jgi:hypothetical protein
LLNKIENLQQPVIAAEGNHDSLISTLAEMRRSLDSFFYDLQAQDRKKVS